MSYEKVDSTGETRPLGDRQGSEANGRGAEQPDERPKTGLLEIPRLLMEREAEKKKEYKERAKIDVKDILNDRELK